MDDEDDELTRDNSTLQDLPSLPPLPPPPSASSSLLSVDAYGSHSQSTAKTRPVGKVQPFHVDTTTSTTVPELDDTSDLTLKSLPPRTSFPLLHSSRSSSTLEDVHSLSKPHPPPVIKTHPPSLDPGHHDDTLDPTHLPPEKQWHLFISHSTSDEQFVKETLLVPLEDTGRLVTACCHYMSPDHSIYIDSDIKQAMKDSCVIMIGLSRAYCNSSRCLREMNSALSFSSKGECTVVVAAFELQSRPSEIKKFLYLDFIDRTKRGNVSMKLEETINSAVSNKLQISHQQQPMSPSLPTTIPPLNYHSVGGEVGVEVGGVEGVGERETRYSDSPINSERSSSVFQPNYDYDFDTALQDMREKGDVSGFDFPREDTQREDMSQEDYSQTEYSQEQYSQEDFSERENSEGDKDSQRREGNDGQGEFFEDERQFGDMKEEDDCDRFSNSGMFGNDFYDGMDFEGVFNNEMGVAIDNDNAIHDEEKPNEKGLVDNKVGGVDDEVGVAINKKRPRKEKEEYEEGELSGSSDDDLSHIPKQQVVKQDAEVDTEERLLSHGEGEGGGGGEEEGEIGELEQSQKIQDFYDKLAIPGADKRNESPILYMRGFNNWVKSILIRTYLPPAAAVLDLCCGKGGDLNKWKEGKIHYFVGADISEASIEHARGRYNDKKMRKFQSNRPVFDGEFIAADCCQVRLQDRYDNPARRFDMTSCQFSLHYAFESYEKACMMLQNACENLRPGGYFIGTTVDGNELISRLRDRGTLNDEGCWTIGNSVFSVTLDKAFNPLDDSTSLPLFGCKYHFQLAGVVNVPEFLLHYPLLVHMLKQWGMKEVLHQNFYDFFTEHKCIPEDLSLLYRMQAFGRNSGTMSPDEWETIGLYLVFVFQKVTTPHTTSTSTTASLHDHSFH